MFRSFKDLGAVVVACAGLGAIPAHAAAPVAVNETAATASGASVRIDLGQGATGGPTRATIVASPTKGKITVIAGTRVIYAPDVCTAGTDSFRFTLSNGSGTSKPATAKVAVTPTASTTGAVLMIDPFLLNTLDNKASLTDIGLDILYRTQNWDAVQAKGLDADGSSAAIAVVQTTQCASDVTITANNGAVVLPYSANFLATPPGAGASSVTVPAASLVKVGGKVYAAALIQAPPAGTAVQFSTPVTVSATQGALQRQATMTLHPPAVVLIHGLWGDATSLQTVETYLQGRDPWHSGGIVEPICYSLYLAFDAKTDPLTTGKDACELTSKAALDVEIAHLMSTLDSRHIVGGRIDVVAHSMGGLVARHYATLSEYVSPRNRGLGAFHELVTLDTPETGSALATYLYNNATKTLQAPFLSSAWNVWEAECDSDDNVRACFNKLDLPLAANSQALKSGAVFSLIPGGPSLRVLPDARIPNVIWRASTATWPDADSTSSLLRSVLDTLLRATYSNTNNAPTLSQILGTQSNDVIVTTTSQLGNAQNSFNFKDLAHTKTPDPSILSVFFDGENQNVEQSGSVSQLVGCWLADTGAASCTQAATLFEGRSGTAAAASTRPEIAKFMAADRMALGTASRTPQFGVPFDLPLNFAASGPSRIVVSQSDRHGEIESGSGAARIVRTAGNTRTIEITPRRFGPMTFKVAATFADGGFALKTMRVNVRPPAAPPSAFSAGRGPIVIALNTDEPVAMLHPEATYPATGTFRLEPGSVTFTAEQSAGAPVISLQGGMIRALRPGEATIEARFGTVVDRVQVIVKRNWE